MDNRINTARQVNQPLPRIMKKASSDSIPKDSFKKSGVETDSKSMQLTREQAAKVLMGTRVVPSASLEKAPKLFNKEEELLAGKYYGTFSTPMISSPDNNTYYTGLFGTSDTDRDYGKKYLTAMNKDGSVKWTYNNESITSAPACDDKGNVYFRSQNSLIALDSSGKELWTFDAPGSSSGQVREELHQRWPDSRNFEDYAPQIGKDGTVFVMTCDNGKGFDNPRVAAVKDGKEMWSAKVSHSGEKGPNFEVRNGDLYVSSIEYRTFKKGWFSDKKTMERNVISIYSPDGSIKAKATEADENPESWSCPSEAHDFSIGKDGSIYANEGGKIVKYDSSGNKAWEFEAKVDPKKPRHNSIWIVGSPANTPDGNLLFPTIERNQGDMQWTSFLNKMDTDGRVLWKKEFELRIKDKPVIDDNGDIYMYVEENDKETESITRLNSAGQELNRYTLKKDPRDFLDVLVSMNPNPGGGVVTETIEFRELPSQGGSRAFSHKRNLSIIGGKVEEKKAKEESEAKEREEAEGGIEQTKEFVIINGVKLPVNKS